VQIRETEIAPLESNLARVVGHQYTNIFPDFAIVFRLKHHQVRAAKTIVLERPERGLIVDIRSAESFLEIEWDGVAVSSNRSGIPPTKYSDTNHIGNFLMGETP
jgi:hypothetical protein